MRSMNLTPPFGPVALGGSGRSAPERPEPEPEWTFGLWRVISLSVYRVNVAGRIVRHAGGVKLRLPRSWPWAQTLATAFARLQALLSG